MQPHVFFLAFIVSEHGISADPKKVRVIREWLEPKSITKTHKFSWFSFFLWEIYKGI